MLEGKYSIFKGRVINTETREPIPDDEPVFLLRAKDSVALDAIRFYLSRCLARNCTIHHVSEVSKRIRLFEKFQKRNEDRIQLPD